MREAARDLLSTIAYRFEKATQHCNSTYPSLNIGKGVRTPLEIVHHMRILVHYATSRLTKNKKSIDKNEEWEVEKKLFLDQLEKLDQLLEEKKNDKRMLQRLIQGPLADMLTHVGQLSMMSRLNDQPVEGINYYDAPIEVGKIKNY